MSKKFSYTIWGKQKTFDNWNNWYKEVNELFSTLGYKITHFGISSKSFQSGKILTVLRTEKKLLETIKSGEIPTSVECYALPLEYKTAIFDYYIFCSRCESYITVVINEQLHNYQIENMIIEFEEKYFSDFKGEIYITSDKEVPMIYAATQDSSNLDSYKKIREIRSQTKN